MSDASLHVRILFYFLIRIDNKNRVFIFDWCGYFDIDWSIII